MVPVPDIVLVIPTFRRPRLLQALLQSLLQTLNETPAFLVVADNDCDGAVLEIVESFKNLWPHCHYIAVPAKGLSNVRNSLVACALALVPEWRWLVMLDDDGVITPDWLRRLVSCGDTYQAQMVGGPVEGILPPEAGFLARHSIFASRTRRETGEVPGLNSTQNLAVSRSLLNFITLPLFSPDFNLSGGEDYDLFRRAATAGARLVWCDEALVFEPTPMTRLTPSSVLSRYFTTGIYMAKIDVSYDGLWPAWLAGLKGAAGSLKRLVFAVVVVNKADLARAILSSAHFAGRLCGLAGWRSARYAAPPTVKLLP